jgi:hypothetical protein
LACDDFLDSSGVEETEDVSVSEEEEHRYPQGSYLESHTDPHVVEDPGVGVGHARAPFLRSLWSLARVSLVTI